MRVSSFIHFIQMRVVGLTGNIAAGKSTVAATLTACGLPLIDSDTLAHAACAPGKWAHRRLLAAFGPSITLDPADPAASPIDRAALGALAFADPAARRKLNAATHLPIAVALLTQLLVAWLACRTVVIVDMPLLFESGFWRLTSPRLLVDAPEGVRSARVQSRDGLTAQAAADRIAAQTPAATKRGRCRWVIENEGSVQAVEAAARRVGVELNRGAWVHWAVSPPAVGVVVAATVGVLMRR